MAKTTSPVIDASPESVKRTLENAQAVLNQTKAEGTKAFAGSSYEKDLQKKQGIVTSKNAENRGKSANETIKNITTPIDQIENPLTEMYKRLGDLQTQLVTAKEKEAADVAAKKATTVDTAAAGGKADMNAAATALNGQGDTQNIQDPVIRALTDKTIANVGIINNQMQTLGQYRQQFNEYTQQDIDSIARTAERSVQRQNEENQRITDAMRFAGVIGGRAQFAPVVEQSIIKDVIQEGLDRVEVIYEKKNTAIRAARKAEAEFNIDIFEKQANLAKEYNNEIESTISKMNAQVRQVEADERERSTYRQAQEERNSLMLAGQLMDATPEKIMQTAAANGIDAGLLTKAVNDARFEKQSNELDIESKQENIKSSQANRANDAIRLGLDQARFNREGQALKALKSDIPDDVEQGFRSVAQLSKGEAEGIWGNIQDYGLNQDTVLAWLDTGKYSKSQVNAIVSAHEQSQRVKGADDTLESTATEKALQEVVRTYKMPGADKDLTDLVTKKRNSGSYIPNSFFKQN